jgi:hypothetical protein
MRTLTELVEDMQPMPGITMPQATAPLLGEDRVLIGGGLTFAGDAGQEIRKVGPELVTDVHAAGIDGVTRYNTFNQVWGHYIHCVRTGELTLAEADARFRGWIAAHMKPAWDEAKIDREMAALTAVDIKNHGPLPSLAPALPEMPSWAKAEMVKVASTFPRINLDEWGEGRWRVKITLKRQFLVEGVLQSRKPHVLVAGSGEGKTGQALDLALKLSAYDKDWTPPSGPLMWWGQPITEHAQGCKMLFVTSEDDEDEIRIRIREHDRDGLFDRAMAEGRLRIVTLIDNGGAFPFLRRDGRSGEAVLTSRWAQLKEEIERYGPNVVVIDTVNSTLHGNDSDPEVIQQYFNELNGFVCGELKATLIVTHHIRKGATGRGGKAGISNLDEMKDAVRGSTALVAAVRCVIGFWHAPDYAKRLKALGLPVERGVCYQGGIVKANNPEFLRGVKTLVRDKTGAFRDVTSEARVANPNALEEKAWIVAAVTRAAHDRHPFYMTKGKSLHARRSSLHPLLHNVSRARFDVLVQELMNDGVLVTAENEKPKGTVLDLPGGKIANGQGYSDSGAWVRPDWSEYQYQGATGMVMGPNGEVYRSHV